MTSLQRVAPWLVLPVLILAALPAMAFSSWVTLTLAGLAMGMMLFLMASGLTLIFGLMDVLNFAHAAFVTLGAYLAVSMLGALSGLVEADSLALNLLALVAALVVAAAVSGAFGFVFEHVIIRRVYGSHLQQILITVGGLIVAEQLIVVVWGAEPLHVAKPQLLRGSFILGGAAVEKYRIAAVGLGLAGVRRDAFGTEPHAHRPAGPRRRREPRDGGGAGLPRAQAVRRRVRRRHRAGRNRRRDVGRLPGVGHHRDRRRHDHPDVHRGDHRRVGLGHRLFRRRHAGRAGGELHRVPGAQSWRWARASR